MPFGGRKPSMQQMAVGGEEPLKAKILVPDPTLFAEPVSTVNTTTAGNQELRSIGATSDGGYTVAWISGTSTLHIQRYDSLGAKEGIETQLPIVVEDAVAQAIQFSSMSVQSDGNVVVVYRAISNTTLPGGTISTKQGLYFQIFSPVGVLLKGQTEVASIEEVIHSRSPSLTDQQNVALADGGFVVGWTVRSFSAQFGYQANLSLQRYDNQGQPVGGVLQVNLWAFIAASVVGRFARFFLVGFITYRFGETALALFFLAQVTGLAEFAKILFKGFQVQGHAAHKLASLHMMNHRFYEIPFPFAQENPKPAPT